jgi:hypothetical protein
MCNLQATCQHNLSLNLLFLHTKTIDFKEHNNGRRFYYHPGYCKYLFINQMHVSNYFVLSLIHTSFSDLNYLLLQNH